MSCQFLGLQLLSLQVCMLLKKRNSEDAVVFSRLPSPFNISAPTKKVGQRHKFMFMREAFHAHWCLNLQYGNTSAHLCIMQVYHTAHHSSRRWSADDYCLANQQNFLLRMFAGSVTFSSMRIYDIFFSAEV